MIEKNYAGLDGFLWWMGIVESRKDPISLGRCQVRVFGWHSESTADIPTKDLPWAHPINSLNSTSFCTPKEGDMVFGFFADGRNAQVPIILGIMPNYPLTNASSSDGFRDPRTSTELDEAPVKPSEIPDPYPRRVNEPSLSRLATNRTVAGTVISARRKSLEKLIPIAGGEKWGEPFPPYDAKYPYNQVVESESGHAFEMDDTPDQERINLNHRSGSYIEFFPSGSKAKKIVKNNYEIVLNDDYVFIKGKCNITVGGDANIIVNGKTLLETNEMDINVKNDFKLKAANIKLEADKGVDIYSTTKLNLQSGTINVKGAAKVGIGAATIDVPAAAINFQSGSVGSASKSGLKTPSISSYSREDYDEPTPEVRANFLFEEPERDSTAYVEQKIDEGIYNKEDIDQAKKAEPLESNTDKGKETPPLSTDCKDIDKMTSFDNSLQLSQHYTLGNMLNTVMSKSVLRDQVGLSKKEIVCNLKLLCINVLEPLKAMYPDMIVTSAFRNNSTVANGVSQHEKGQAADIQIPSYSKTLEKYYDAVLKIRDSITHDQLLLEYTNTSKSAPGTWIHITFNPKGNRPATAANKHLTFLNHKTYKAGYHKLKTGPAPGNFSYS